MAVFPLMFCSAGVVIQPSAFRAIHSNVFGPPLAPMISGTCAWTGFGNDQHAWNLMNSPL